MASISFSKIPCKSKTKFDVFLSFRGSDTRPNFTSHLYAALSRKYITTFMDDHGLQRGEGISSTLLKAIEESKISLIIFSENYASSRWCLDELVSIMECKKAMGRNVIPIFYHVEPSDVRKQTGNFGEAFRIVKGKFKKSRVKRWTTALTEAANLSGWNSCNYRAESELIEKVADHIIKKLYAVSCTATPDLIGINSHIEQILSRLSIGSEDVRFVGIWGMGGIGKTTIAEVIYGQICDQFDCCCFFRDVREKSEKCELVHLRRSFFSELLGDENLQIQMLHVIPTFIKDLLSRKKVLLVLDDINSPSQLEALGVTGDWYGEGSRIILTSRDKQVLKAAGIDDHGIYMADGLNDNDALRLLSIKAFRQWHPPRDYTELSRRVVNYAKGVPLALRVLGSHLCRRSLDEWEIVLNKLKQVPDSTIQKILEISYKDLVQEEKDTFLDIACFFKGCDKDWVESILNGCGFPSAWIVMRLMDKCLITIAANKIGMHDLIRVMGQDIARREGSRLWNSQAICSMLRTNMGNEEVQGIFLDMSEIGQVHLNLGAFSRMSNLRLLKFYYADSYFNNESPLIVASGQSSHLHCLPTKLSLLHWEHYPCKSLPPSFYMENLVELRMVRSNLRHLWDGDMPLQNLKRLKLSNSRHLRRLPNFSSAINLTMIAADYCVSLVRISSSIQGLYKLTYLRLSGCRKLRRIPSLVQLKSLKHLFLNECSNLKMLPEIPPRIAYLDLRYSGLAQWSPLIRFLDNLSVLKMHSCRNLTSITSNIHLNYSLNIKKPTLDLSGCWSLQKLPVINGFLKELHLSRTRIVELPSSLRGLPSLVRLFIRDCKSLETLRNSICELKCLEMLVLSGCSKLEELPALHGMCSLKKLYLDKTAIKELPASTGCLSMLRTLRMGECMNLETLPDSICELKCLEVLVLSGCSKLKKLPPLHGLCSIKQLHLSCTAVKELPRSIGCLTSLVILRMEKCESLEILPDSICELKQLEKLHLSGCSKLWKLSSLRGLGSLKLLYLDETAIAEVPDDIVSLSSLRKLYLFNCKRLQGLPELPSQLMRVRVDDCRLLETAVSSSSSAPLESEWRTNHYVFNYCNCLRLDQNARCNIMADAQLRMTEIAIANLRNQRYDSFNIILPGSEIPEWFSYQSLGSSIDFEFPPYRSETVFLGFAFCVVLEPKFPSFECCCHFRNGAARENISFFKPGPMHFNGDPESEHLLMWYVTDTDSCLHLLNEWVIENSWNVNEALLEFKPHMQCDSRGRVLKVKRSGVHLIYANR